MPDLSSTVGSGLANYFEKVAAKIHKWVDPLSSEQFWRNPFPYGNDIGHLVLHLTGNLNYYIGTQIAGTGYVRDRDHEFTEKNRPAKEEMLAAFDCAVALINATIRQQSAEDWTTAYSAERSTAKDRFSIVLDCAAHADHHAGQIINLSRELTR
jgi:uncharacterized damage-inducible protein DinB